MDNNFESFEKFLSEDKGFQLLEKIDKHNKILCEKFDQLKSVIKDLKLTKKHYDLYKSAVSDYLRCLNEEKALWLEFREYTEKDKITLHDEMSLFEPFLQKLKSGSLEGIDNEIEKLDNDLNTTLEVVYSVSKLFKDTRDGLRKGGPMLQNMVKLCPPENMDITILDIVFDNEEKKEEN